MLVIARSEVGKSAWANQVLVNAAKAGTPGMYVSAEMGAEDVVCRAYSSAMDIPIAEVEKHIVSTALDPAFLAATEVLKVLTVLDKPAPTWDDIGRVLNSAPQRPHVVVVDHLQLVAAEKFTKADSRVTEVAKAAKVFAKKEKVFVILLHQVARGSVSNEAPSANFTGLKPVPSKNHGDVPLSAEDGYQAGEQDADYVVALYRPEKRPGQGPEFYTKWEGRLVVQLVKNRHGVKLPRGLVCAWHSNTMLIEETHTMEEWEQVQQTIETLGKDVKQGTRPTAILVNPGDYLLPSSYGPLPPPTYTYATGTNV